MADQDCVEEKAMWSIKAMPLEARHKAMDCARKQDETAAEWLVRAIDNQAKLEAGERILPPLTPQQTPLSLSISITPDQLGMIASSASHIAEATGVPVPKTVARHFYALLDTLCRAERGMPPKKRAIRQIERAAGESREPIEA